jgi:hypothetical protein
MLGIDTFIDKFIDPWPNELGRFASSPTGAHVSDPFSKIDQPTRAPISLDPSALDESDVRIVSERTSK